LKQPGDAVLEPNTGMLLHFPDGKYDVGFFSSNASWRRCMNNIRWMQILFLSGSLWIGPVRMLGAVEQRPAENSLQEGIHFNEAPAIRFIGDMTRRLHIHCVILHHITMSKPVTIHKEAPVSNQELLDLFVSGLHDCDAVLVRKGEVFQIVPLSQPPHEGWAPVVALSQTVSTAKPWGNTLMINFENLDLSELLPIFLNDIKLRPVVISPYVSGKANILSSEPFHKTMVPELLMAFLENSGAALIESQGKYKIVPTSKRFPEGWEEITQPPPLMPGAFLPCRHLNRQEWESLILSTVNPKLPQQAGPFKQPEVVQIIIYLNENGELDRLYAREPTPNRCKEYRSLAESAIEALQQWKFKPFIGSDGRSKCVDETFDIVFSDAGVEFDYTSHRR
jgi:hypothetical protein